MNDRAPEDVTAEEFKQLFRPGTRIEWGGTEYIALNAWDESDPDDPNFTGLQLAEHARFSLTEFQHGEFEVEDNPQFKVPSLTKYPPQVFVLTDATDSDKPEIHVYADLGTL